MSLLASMRASLKEELAIARELTQKVKALETDGLARPAEEPPPSSEGWNDAGGNYYSEAEGVAEDAGSGGWDTWPEEEDPTAVTTPTVEVAEPAPAPVPAMAPAPKSGPRLRSQELEKELLARQREVASLHLRLRKMQQTQLAELEGMRESNEGLQSKLRETFAHIQALEHERHAERQQFLQRERERDAVLELHATPAGADGETEELTRVYQLLHSAEERLLTAELALNEKTREVGVLQARLELEQLALGSARQELEQRDVAIASLQAALDEVEAQGDDHYTVVIHDLQATLRDKEQLVKALEDRRREEQAQWEQRLFREQFALRREQERIGEEQQERLLRDSRILSLPNPLSFLPSANLTCVFVALFLSTVVLWVMWSHRPVKVRPELNGRPHGASDAFTSYDEAGHEPSSGQAAAVARGRDRPVLVTHRTNTKRRDDTARPPANPERGEAT